MASTTADRRIALQYVVDKLDPANSAEQILNRANAYAEFLTTGRLPNDTAQEPEEFDPVAE